MPETDQSDVVAITLPVRNGAADLDESIRSLLNQSYENIRLMVCDNASTDATPDIAADFARHDPRVTLQRFKEPVGICESENRAWLKTDKNAAYFQWASDDDYWEPDFITELVAALNRSPTASLAFCHYEYINLDGSRVTTDPLARTCTPEDSTGLSRVEAVIQQIHTKEGRHPWYGIAPMHVALRRQPYVVPKFTDDILPMLEAAWMGDIVIVPKVLFRCRLGGISVNRHEDPTSYRGEYYLDEVATAYIERMVPSIEDRQRITAELKRYIEMKNEQRHRQRRRDSSLLRRALRRLHRLGVRSSSALGRH